MARPRIELNVDTFKELCRIQCTLEEIASVMNVSDRTIERWCQREFKESFVDTYKKFSEDGKMSLRRLQFRAAENGSVPMMIWLGKQWLGQTEKQEVAVAKKDDETIKEMEAYFANKNASTPNAEG